jgi:hypothetical protein
MLHLAKYLEGVGELEFLQTGGRTDGTALPDRRDDPRTITITATEALPLISIKTVGSSGMSRADSDIEQPLSAHPSNLDPTQLQQH